MYNKLIVTCCVLFYTNSIGIKAQILSEYIPEKIFCYLVIDNQKKDKKMTLLIYNETQDNFVINDFNKYIHHESSLHYKKQEEQVFFWNLLTLSNKEPEDVVIILPQEVVDKKHKKQQALEKNKTITIRPESLFVSDIYMVNPHFVSYPKGFYKLCLYYKGKDKCVAEIIIKKE